MNVTPTPCADDRHAMYGGNMVVVACDMLGRANGRPIARRSS